MAIGKIITGQTFGNWLNTTNLLIDEVNQATDTYSQGKLVRWGVGGVITVNALTTTSLQLSSGNSVNAVSNNWASPIDDSTLMTSNAVHGAILNADTIRLVHPTRVTSDIIANTISVVTENNQVISVSNTATEFFNDVILHKDMTVLGTKTELNVVTMEVEDSNIQLNVGSGASKFTANNAGFDVGSTNAFMRLINTGTEFPEIIPATARLNNIYKVLEVDVNGGGYISKSAIEMNEKDRLEISYVKPSQATIDATYGTFYNANDFVIGISSQQSDTMSVPYDQYPFASPSAYYRENFVLDPANYNGEITYEISGTSYLTYADYKTAFASAPAGSSVKITVDPRLHRQLYYWIGEVDKTTYANTEVQFMVDNSGRKFTKIDFPTGFPIEENPTLELFVGDEIKFEINLQSNLNANAFFIGTTSYADVNRLHPTTVEMGGGHNITSTIYEVDGVVHGVTIPSGPADFSAYESDFQTGNWANVTFIPSQPGTYYYWASGNSADPNFQMGGQINVYAKHVNMGGSISVEYPMGKTVTKNVTYDPAIFEFELDTIPTDDVYLEAGDTVTFNITNSTHTGNVFVISSTSGAGAESDYAVENVLYSADGNSEYRIWTDYENNFSSNSYSNVTFTPFSAGTYYYYANNNPSSNGKIIVSGTRPYDLGAYHLSTDNSTATIENPIKFSVTKNKFPLMELDGELADFFGTKNGIRLPNNSYDYTPTANGIIRYNDALHLFEGYTQGQWRGLGGVVDLNQDTYVETDDFNDTIYFVANSANVSQMRKTDMFFETNREEMPVMPLVPGAYHKVSKVRVESNANTLEYSINVDGSANTYDGIGWNLESGDAGIKVDHRGVDITGKGYLKLPYGETYDRPYFAANGMIRVVKEGIHVVDSTGNTANVDVLEMYMEDRWQPLSVIENEYSYFVTLPGSNTVSFANLYTPFTKDDIEVHVNGLKIERTDFDIVNTPNNVYQLSYTYDSLTNDYPYTAGITSLDTGDELNISYTGIQGLGSNSAAIAIGSPDPLNPGSFIPTVNVDYYVDGVLATTFNNYVNSLLTSNTAVANTVDIVYTASTPGTFYLYAIDIANNTVNGGATNVPINVTGQTSYTSNLVFQTNRSVGQIVNVRHSLGRKIGVNRIDVLSRSELANGLSTNVRFSGQVTIGAGQPSTSTTTGALVINGGIGLSGDVFVGRSITELSAAELKTDISNINSPLDKVIAMNGVEFSWKDDESKNREYGLIADDVAKIAPSLVSFAGQKPQGVKYSKVVALLIEAMKQQQDEIELLKSQLPKKRGRKSNSTKE